MCINFVPPVQFLQIQLLAIFALLTIYHKALPTGWLQDLHTCHCPIAMHNVQSLTCHRASHSSVTSPSSLPAATTVHMSCPTSPVHSDSPLAMVHHMVDKPLWGCNGMERRNSSKWHVRASTLAHAHTVQLQLTLLCRHANSNTESPLLHWIVHCRNFSESNKTAYKDL